LEQQWTEASSEVRQIYSHEYIDSEYTAISEHSKSAASSLAPVIDTLEKVVTQTRLRNRYLIDGGNQLSDFPNVS
jgi:hypothetical protein